MASLDSIDRLLTAAGKLLDQAASEIREAKAEPVYDNIEHIGHALSEVFKIQQCIYGANPELAPSYLSDPSESAEANRLLSEFICRVSVLERAGNVEDAIAELEHFVALESSPLHLEIATAEIERLGNAARPSSDPIGIGRAPMEVIARARWAELKGIARDGDPEAQWEVGYYYECGAEDESGATLTDVDLTEAAKWYRLSAAQGNSNAQTALSTMLSTGEGVARDFLAAIHWAKKAIAQGNATAAFNLGTIYRDLGKPDLAFRWYGRAASMGDLDALLQVGLCYMLGFGTKRDFDSAHSSFSRVVDSDPAASCQRSKENALYWRAVLELATQRNTRKTIDQARKKLELANADDDHEQANEILNVIGKTRYLSA